VKVIKKRFPPASHTAENTNGNPGEGTITVIGIAIAVPIIRKKSVFKYIFFEKF
jgi:hypothetical protein